jgi:hypothetical protein
MYGLCFANIHRLCDIKTKIRMSMAIQELSYLKYQDIIKLPITFTLSGGNTYFIEENMHFTIFQTYKKYHMEGITEKSKLYVEYKRNKIMNLIIKNEDVKDVILKCSGKCILTKYNAIIGVYKTIY